MSKRKVSNFTFEFNLFNKFFQVLSIFIQKQTKNGEICHAKLFNLKQLGQNKP
jgi:hypothetical protein